MEKEHDFIVIGGGSAGYAAARTARELTANVAIVDGSRELGGLCILRGCMPSKTLLHAADVLHHARHGEKIGVHCPDASMDMKKLNAWKRYLIDDFASYRREGLESDRFALYRQNARFTGPRELELADGTRLRGKKILVATGSVVNRPPVPGLDSPGIWTSDDVLDLDFLPESVVVIGGGIVACELAQFLNRAGAEVTLVQRSKHLLTGLAPDLADVALETFRAEGMTVHTGTGLQSVSREGDGFLVRFEQDGRDCEVRGQHCLNALGRRPNTAGLNPEAAGIKTAPNGGLPANSFQQTSNPDIYAAGDCAGPHEIVHIAIQQGETAARHAMGLEVKPVNYDHLVQVVFSDPQIAAAGLSAAQLREAGRDFIQAEYPFNDHGKSMVMDATRGFVRVFAEKPSGKILGAEIAGKDAGEMIHVFSVALTLGATAQDLARAPWYHPTLSEIISYPVEEIAEALSG